MANWKSIAKDANRAVKEVDKAIHQLETKTIAALDAAIANGKVTKAEKSRINAFDKQTKQLINARNKIINASIDALDRSPDLVKMQRRFRGIRQSLANREAEMKQEEQLANSIGRALSIVAGILTLLG